MHFPACFEKWFTLYLFGIFALLGLAGEKQVSKCFDSYACEEKQGKRGVDLLLPIGLYAQFADLSVEECTYSVSNSQELVGFFELADVTISICSNW